MRRGYFQPRESFCFIFGLLVCYCFGLLVLPVVNIKKPRYVYTLEIGKFILSRICCTGSRLHCGWFDVAEGGISLFRVVDPAWVSRFVISSDHCPSGLSLALMSLKYFEGKLFMEHVSLFLYWLHVWAMWRWFSLQETLTIFKRTLKIGCSLRAISEYASDFSGLDYTHTHTHTHTHTNSMVK